MRDFIYHNNLSCFPNTKEVQYSDTESFHSLLKHHKIDTESINIINLSNAFKIFLSACLPGSFRVK